MRKRVMNEGDAKQGNRVFGNHDWLDLETLAAVEVSSEAEGFPVENALLVGNTGNWRANAVGEARIELRFDAPQALSNTLLTFVEKEHERAQEWALTAVFADGSRREVLRQGWNFSPGGAEQSREQSDVYRVDLMDVVQLSLWIDPDRGRDRYPATLQSWLLAK